MRKGVNKVALRLFEHNEKAYHAAVRMMEQYGKAAIVHPTGTGKSYIAFKLIEENPEKVVIWLSPSEYIFKTQMESLKKNDPYFLRSNVHFYIYSKLMCCTQAQLAELLHADKAAIARRTKNLEAKGLLIRRDAPSDRRSQLLYPTKKAESLRSSKAEIEAAFYEYLTNVLTAEEAAAFAAALNKLYTASKTESRAGFPHFRKAAGGEAAHEKG